MTNIKIKTSKEHRFGRIINIKGTQIEVDNTGVAEVSEKLVVYALAAGFELVNKNVKFSTEEDHIHNKEVQGILDAANEKANQIIADANEKANQIIADANEKANQIIADNYVEEKEKKREELLSKTNDELKSALSEAGVDEKLWKDAKKEVLVDLIMALVFDGIQE